MLRDPFYRQIVEGLTRPLDGNHFERCAADLLRADFPGTVPIPGGTDAGMDGAVPDGEGTAYPIVCTTGSDVIGNLTRNLKQYVNRGEGRRKVILATSQVLTPRKRKNLEERAIELGFVPVQIYVRESIAALLYRHPRWCLDLLNLPGNPPPLSVIPMSYRPLGDQPLIGRQDDLARLMATTDDVFLVGQPGSGKTFVLYEMAKQGAGLFVVSSSLTEIAGAIREQQPDTLIVDDAHVNLETLRGLIHLRRETGYSFRIVASCWPGEAEPVAGLLDLPMASRRSLQPLARDEIVDVITGAGLRGPDELIRTIVDQSDGQPGLATTLTLLCLRGDMREVALGDALSSMVRRTFESLVGPDAVEILAALALGGDSGMTLQAVAAALGCRLMDARRIVIGLRAGGVVVERREDRLAVRPRELRYALVRIVFFSGATSLPADKLIRAAPDRDDLAETLIGARARGAVVPDELIRTLLDEAGTRRCWEAYAALGCREAEYVLSRRPQFLPDVVGPALYWAPAVALPALLAAAVGDTRLLHSTTSHPLRLIQDWIESARPGTGEAIYRRETLFKVAKTWLTSASDAAVGTQALCFSLWPGFDFLTTDPGRGMTVHLYKGLLTPDELRRLGQRWPDVLETLKATPQVSWIHLLELIERWVYPSLSQQGEVADESKRVMRDVAREMVRDAVVLAADHPGVLRRLQRLQRRLGLSPAVNLDAEFSILFPDDLHDRPRANWEIVLAQQVAEVRQLARRLQDEDPAAIASRLAKFEAEAGLAGRTWPRYTPLLAEALTGIVTAPFAWLRTFVDARLAPDAIIPFMLAAAAGTQPPPGWEQAVTECLDASQLRHAALYTLLTMPTPPTPLLPTPLYVAHHATPLLAKAMDVLSGQEQLVEMLCLHGQVPEPTLVRLLRHRDAQIAEAAAIGEWLRNAQSGARPSLAADWRNAVLRIPGEGQHEEHWLGEILKADPQLAHDWLRRYLRRGSVVAIFELDGHVRAAISALGDSARRCILSIAPDSFGSELLVSEIVGDDIELYRTLLASKRSTHLKLAPLAGRPIGAWPSKARAALDADFSAAEIASAVGVVGESWVGDESNHWSGSVDQWSALCDSQDEGIREVGTVGRAIAEARREKALHQERHEAVYGR